MMPIVLAAASLEPLTIRTTFTPSNTLGLSAM
jgi:hypothetical protein